jgi:hypothetical protein
MTNVQLRHVHRDSIDQGHLLCPGADTGMDASGWVALPELLAKLDCNATEAEVLAVIDTSEKVLNAFGVNILTCKLCL